VGADPVADVRVLSAPETHLRAVLQDGGVAVRQGRILD
jgi:hypothetical protein